MPTVNLPPGCSRIRMEDGQLYRAGRPGGKISVSDEHAKAIDKLRGNGEGGLVHATFREYGTPARSGRWCMSCVPPRLWNAWNVTCPRCGAETVPE